MRSKLLLALCASLWSFGAFAANARIDVIPQPQHVEMQSGVFVLHAHEKILAPQDARGQEIAAFLRDSLRDQTGIELQIAPANAHPARIVLRLDHSVAGDEAYRLAVAPSHVEIAASSEHGLFWGVQTLLQLPMRANKSHWEIPSVRIDDAPSYPWRGAMLDVARHFFPVQYVEKQIDAMSRYKLDVFHWHLTDDQGWRIQIRRYPKLTDVGAWRTEADGSRYGGFYTQAQIREVVEYARRRNVMVVPEIEMPGHTSAAIAAYPQLSCSGQAIAVPTTHGVLENADCVGNDATFEFLQNVLDEVTALFPAPYVHIGGDEVPQDVWDDCESCTQLAKAKGLQGEQGLHGYFVERIRQYLEGKGKTLIGWDEILEGRLDPHAIVESWRGDAASAKALANDNRVIVAGPFYFDTPIDDMTLQDVYRTDAFADPAYATHRTQVLGAEAPLWSERVTPLNGDAMFYPRLLALSERLWNPAARAYTDFERRVQSQYPWLASQRVAYGPEDVDVADYRLGYNTAHGRWRVRAARGFDDVHLHYTLDGSEPTLQSPWFDDVLDLYAPPADLRVAPFRNGVQYHDAAEFRFAGNSIALGKPMSFATAPDAKYAGALNDGILGSADFHDGAWAGWQGADMGVTIDLQQPAALHSIDVRFLQQSGAWILLPREVSFATSDDGEHWHTMQTIALNPDPRDTRISIRDVAYTLPKTPSARFLRVTATRYGKPVAGSQPWIFCDEVVVR